MVEQRLGFVGHLILDVESSSVMPILNRLGLGHRGCQCTPGSLLCAAAIPSDNQTRPLRRSCPAKRKPLHPKRNAGCASSGQKLLSHLVKRSALSWTVPVTGGWVQPGALAVSAVSCEGRYSLSSPSCVNFAKSPLMRSSDGRVLEEVPHARSGLG